MAISLLTFEMNLKAMLIVGYGEDITKHGTVEKYWIGMSFTLYFCRMITEHHSNFMNPFIHFFCNFIVLYNTQRETVGDLVGARMDMFE